MVGTHLAMMPSTPAQPIPALTVMPPPPPKTPPPRYRVVTVWNGHAVVYRPQWRCLFWWFKYTKLVRTMKRHEELRRTVEFDTLDEAKAFVKEQKSARDRKPEPAPYVPKTGVVVHVED